MFAYYYVALCASPINPLNGKVIITGNSIGDVATYACDSLLTLYGTSTATCTWIDETKAAFVPTAPRCICKCFS